VEWTGVGGLSSSPARTGSSAVTEASSRPANGRALFFDNPKYMLGGDLRSSPDQASS